MLALSRKTTTMDMHTHVKPACAVEEDIYSRPVQTPFSLIPDKEEGSTKFIESIVWPTTTSTPLNTTMAPKLHNRKYNWIIQVFVNKSHQHRHPRHHPQRHIHTRSTHHIIFQKGPSLQATQHPTPECCSSLLCPTQSKSYV